MPEKLIVLMLNDYPVGVYSTSAEADTAAETDRKKRTPHAVAALYYHQHEFVLNAEPFL